MPAGLRDLPLLVMRGLDLRIYLSGIPAVVLDARLLGRA
jgi:hypothetical protein